MKEGYLKRGDKYVSVVGDGEIKLTNDRVTKFFWNIDENYVRMIEGDKYLSSNGDVLKLQLTPEVLQVFEGKQKGNRKMKKKQLTFVPGRISKKNLIFHTKNDIKNNDSNEDNEISNRNKEKSSNSDCEQESLHDSNSENDSNQEEDMTSNESNKSGKQWKKLKGGTKKRFKKGKKTKTALRSSEKDKENMPMDIYVSSSEDEIQPDAVKEEKVDIKKTGKSKKPDVKAAFNKAKGIFMDKTPFGKIIPGGFKSALMDSENEERTTSKSFSKNIKKKIPSKKPIVNNKHHNYLKLKTRYNNKERHSLNSDTTEKLRKISRLVDRFRSSLER